MPDRSFKVVIVGASVAGLSLANMLQANGIDFIVLESFPVIAPQVGASIGLLPHGNRILDQLGLYRKIADMTIPVDTFVFRGQEAKPLACYKNMDKKYIERHGYPMIFLDRQSLLQVLYDNIRDKRKIMPGNRVVRVKLHDHGVKAVTADGTRFEGDILIGADGIHSKVRREMRRLANDAQPGSFEEEGKFSSGVQQLMLTLETELPCEYNCIFGISRPCRGISPGVLHGLFRDGSSYLITGGLGGRVYWFRFQKLDKKLCGAEIPRYTKQDLYEALEQSRNDFIAPGVRFHHLIANRITAVMTPLPEYIYKRWHFSRIFTLGDSAHKVHPIGGHGGNAAIETAATLTNGLAKALGTSGFARLDLAQISRLFGEVQALRRPRMLKILEYSHKRQLIESLDGRLQKFIALYALPLLREEVVTQSFSAQIPGAEKLDMFDLAPRAKLIPYKDELVSEPRSRGVWQWLLVVFYLACSAAAFCFPGSTASREFVGLGLSSFAIVTVEGFRDRKRPSVLEWPTLWFLVAKVVGITVAMPLYCAVHTLASDAESYWWWLRRGVYSRPHLGLGFHGMTCVFLLMLEDGLGPVHVWNLLWVTAFWACHNVDTRPDAHDAARQEVSDLVDLARHYAAVACLCAMLYSRLFLVLFWGNSDGGFSKDANQYLCGHGLVVYVWCVCAVWDLKRVGRARVLTPVAAVAVLVSFVLIGPEVTMTLVWAWREEVLARVFPKGGEER